MALNDRIIDKNYFFLVLIHIGLGFAIFIIPVIAKLYFVAALIYFLFRIIISSNTLKSQEVLLGCAYFVGAEVLFRMTKSGLSYEASKYLVILFVLIGMFFKGISGKGYPYFIYLILLVPAVVVASITLTIDAKFRTNIAFVLSGPVCLGIAALFCYDRRISYHQIMDILVYISLPIISMTVYIFLYNPSIKSVLYGTASSNATSGGFGPNQVSTVLGLGIFCMVVRLFLKSPTLFLKIVNIVLLGTFTFRGIVTFSRGGVVAAVIVVAGFLWSLYFKSRSKQKNKIILSFILLLITVNIAWVISSNQTRGLIDLRYANLDVQGREKKDITTGRVDLFVEEIDGFLGNPFIGIGASRVKDKRVEISGQHLPSHSEVGRLLSEHGLLGLIILSILVLKPLTYYGRNRKNLFFYAFLFFWFATINHSGMRIAAPSFLYALALLNVVNEKNPLHRKQLKQ